MKMVLTLSSHGGAAQAMDSVKPLLEEKWKELARRVPSFHSRQNEFWSYRITLPFPAFWPPASENPLVYYAVPYGIDPGKLADAELVGAPWARIAFHQSLPLRLELLEKKIVKLGIQGVRPITQKEKEIYSSEKEITGYLAKLSSPPDESAPEVKQLRDFYRRWKSHNGVLADRLVEYHRSFFNWLMGKE